MADQSKDNHIIQLIGLVVIFSAMFMMFGYLLGMGTGESRVRFEASKAAKVCGQLRDMRLNELSAAFIASGGRPEDTRFFDCRDMEAIAQDTYWDASTKSIYFENRLAGPPRD